MDAFTPIIAVHAVAALFVLVLGPFQILRRRRDLGHRILGASWVGAMALTCTTSFWIMPHGFSWLHGLSIWTLVCMVLAIAGIRARNVPVHRGFMIGSYLGTLAAFAFAALVPERLIPQLLREQPVVALGTVVAVGVLVLAWSVLVLRSTTRLPSAAADRPVAHHRRAAADGAHTMEW